MSLAASGPWRLRQRHQARPSAALRVGSVILSVLFGMAHLAAALHAALTPGAVR